MLILGEILNSRSRDESPRQHGFKVNHRRKYIVNGDYKGHYNILAELVDTFGPRDGTQTFFFYCRSDLFIIIRNCNLFQTGSGQLEAAIDWMLEKSHEEGLENIHTEDVSVPHWVRNNESAWMVLPRLHKLNMLGLGSSVGTPPEGIRAEVLVVKDFDDLEANAHLSNRTSPAAGTSVAHNPPWVSYGETVQYRASGATRAAKVGAVASLIRSVGPFSINSPHTGHQYYGDAPAKIPTACITVEDAAMMERMQDRGQKIEVLLTMGAMNYPDFVSRNSIVEVEGLEWPDETVVVSGPPSSWDVGSQGAMDIEGECARDAVGVSVARRSGRDGGASDVKVESAV
ncbi:carboxypeptidase Q-like [Penaeus japonicus]|uniref:carboxypeptidase Q-like n=1 Tax=Penaeus japonicus TaxID=27405 RepID=UPI001C71693C|nr:carboxypeptidase Q-like [Penaeus japonicus]